MAETWQRIDVGLVARTRHRPFSARNALRVTALVAGLHAIILVASPRFGLSLFGAEPVSQSIYWLRTCGVLFAVLTLVFGSASRWPASMMQRPVLLSAGILSGVLALIGVLAILDGTVQATYAGVVGSEAALAAWIWWLLLTDGI